MVSSKRYPWRTFYKMLATDIFQSINEDISLVTRYEKNILSRKLRDTRWHVFTH